MDAKQVLLLQFDSNVKKAMSELADTRAEIEKLKEQQKGLNKANKDDAILYEELAAKIRTLNGIQRDQQKTVDLVTKSRMAETDSNEQLRAKVASLTLEYDKMSKATRKSADGIALKDSIKSMRDELKETTEEVGIFNMSVGDYKNKIMEAMGLNPQFAKTLSGIGTAGGVTGKTLATQGVAGAKAFGSALLSLLANPVVAVIAAIALGIMLVVGAIRQNGEATERLSRILAPFKALISGVVTILGHMVDAFLKGVEWVEKWAISIAKLIPGLDQLAAKAEEAIELERIKQQIAEEYRQEIVNDARDEMNIADLKIKMTQKHLYSDRERLAFARQADKIYRDMMVDDVARATNTYNQKVAQMKNEGKTYKDLTEQEKNDFRTAEAAMFNIRKEFRESTRRLSSMESKLVTEIETEARQKAEKAAQDSQRAAEKREERRKKAIKIESDLFVLSKQTELAILEQTASDVKKSDSQRYTALSSLEAIKIAILTDTANSEIAINKLVGREKLAVETRLAEDIKELKRGTEKSVSEIEAKAIEDRIKAFEKERTAAQTELQGQAQDELTSLSRRYAAGKISKERYEKEKVEIAERYHAVDFNATMDNLSREMGLMNLNKDQKEAIEKAISDTRVKYAKETADKTVKANEEAADKIEARDKQLTELKKELYAQLQTTFADIGNGIFNRQMQKYDQETEKVNESQAKQLAAIENREKNGTLTKAQAEKSREKIDNDTQKQLEQLEKKKKKADRDKAMFNRGVSLFNVGLFTAEAIAKSVAEFPLTAGMPFAAIAAGIGALQVASILAQPLPIAATGMRVKGRRHSRGGELVNVEDGEWIINRRSSAMFDPLLAMINDLGNGGFNDYGYAAREISGRAVSTANQNIIAGALGENSNLDKVVDAIKELKIYTSIEELREEDKKFTTLENLGKQ